MQSNKPVTQNNKNVSKLSSSQISSTSSPKTKPPVSSNSYSKNIEFKVRYESYYNWKSPDKLNSDISDMRKALNSWMQAKYWVSSQQNNSYERPNKNTNSIKGQIQYSKVIDSKLNKPLKENQILQNEQEKCWKK